MNGTLNAGTTFWFNKSIKESIHPVNSLFLTDGQDLKNRPVLMLVDVPKPSLGLASNYKEIAYFLQDYLGYLISLIPPDRIKRGVCLIVDATLLKKAEVDVVKEFINEYKNPGSCLLYVYCLCNLQSNASINQNTFTALPAGIQVFLISSIAQLMIRVPSSQLHPIYGGTLKFNHPVWKRFMETFEALEAYVTKYLNRSMMFREKADIILKRRNPEELSQIRPTLNYMNNVTVLQQCERVMNKFRNPANYNGLMEVQNNPAFDLARRKLEFYIAILMNNHNYYVHNIKYIEDLLGIKESPRKRKIQPNQKDAPVQDQNANKVKNLLTLSNLFQISLDDKKEDDYPSLKTIPSDQIVEPSIEKTIGKSHLDDENMVKSQPLSLLNQIAAFNIDEDKLKSSQSSPQTSPLALKLSRLLLLNQFETKDEPVQLNVRKSSSDDNDEDRLNFPKPKPRKKRLRSHNQTVERETQTFDEDHRRSAIIQTDIAENITETNLTNDLITNQIESNSANDFEKNRAAVPPTNESPLSNYNESNLEKVQIWYLKALALFDENFLKDINDAKPNQMTKDEHRTKCEDFLSDNKLDEEALLYLQNNAKDINDAQTKQDLPILIYRVNCLKKILNNMRHLKLIELKEVKLWKEQLEITTSKIKTDDNQIVENEQEVEDDSTKNDIIARSAETTRQNQNVEEFEFKNDANDIINEDVELNFEKIIQDVDEFLKKPPKSYSNSEKNYESNHPAFIDRLLDAEKLNAIVYKDPISREDNIKISETGPKNSNLLGLTRFNDYNSIDSGINSPFKSSDFNSERDPLDNTPDSFTHGKAYFSQDNPGIFDNDQERDKRIVNLNRFLNEYDLYKNDHQIRTMFSPWQGELILKPPKPFGPSDINPHTYNFLPISPPTYSQVTSRYLPNNDVRDDGGLYTVFGGPLQI